LRPLIGSKPHFDFVCAQSHPSGIGFVLHSGKVDELQEDQIVMRRTIETGLKKLAAYLTWAIAGAEIGAKYPADCTRKLLVV
jgi:hypothetical protein